MSTLHIERASEQSRIVLCSHCVDSMSSVSKSSDCQTNIQAINLVQDGPSASTAWGE